MILEPDNLRKPRLSSLWLDSIREEYPEERVGEEEQFFTAFEWKLAHKRRLRRMQSQGHLERALTSLFENLGFKEAA